MFRGCLGVHALAIALFQLIGARLLATSGSAGWGVQYGSSGNDVPNALRVDANGEVYVTGECSSSLYGSSSGGNDFWLAKLNGTTGELIWGAQGGSSDGDYAEDIIIDDDGDVYVTGRTFGILYGSVYVGAGDYFLAKYRGSDGVFLWGVQEGSIVPDYGQKLDILRRGSDSTIEVTGAGM